MQTPLAPRIMPYHSQRQWKMLTLRYITMENFKINTTCTYALKQDRLKNFQCLLNLHFIMPDEKSVLTLLLRF